MSIEYLTTHEVADKLKTSVKTVYRLILSGDLPATKIRQQYRVSSEAVDRLLIPEAREEPAPRNERAALRKLLKAL